MAGAVLHGDVEPQGREVRVEHARVVALVAGDVIVGVPLVGDARKEGAEQRLDPREVVRLQPPVQVHLVRRLARRVLHEVAEEALVQALADLAVRVTQPIQQLATEVLHRRDGQVSRLEQQRLGGDVVHVECGQQVVVAQHPVQGHRGDPAPEQGLDEERGRAGLEPPGPELAVAEQQQDVEGVVDLLLAPPAVAVVPLADGVAVEPRQLGREHRIQVRLRIAANGGVARVQGEVLKVVEPGEQAHLGELAHPGEEGEADVGVAGLDDRVQPLQIVPVGAGHLRDFQGVQNRFVVLVDQHHRPLPGVLVQPFQQRRKPSGRGPVIGTETRAPLGRIELLHGVGFEMARILEVTGPEVEPHHRMAYRPVPMPVDVEPFEQGLVALEQLLQGVEEQALAEAPRAGEKVVRPAIEHAPDVRRLVDVIAVVLANLAEGLDADGELPPVHPPTLQHGRPCGTRRTGHSPPSERRAIRGWDREHPGAVIGADGQAGSWSAWRSRVRSIGPPRKISVQSAPCSKKSS